MKNTPLPLRYEIEGAVAVIYDANNERAFEVFGLGLPLRTPEDLAKAAEAKIASLTAVILAERAEGAT